MFIGKRLQHQVVAMAISRATCAHAQCTNLEAGSGVVGSEEWNAIDVG